MSTRSNTLSDNPFAALDADWAALCRHHRRSTVVARWARSEAELSTLRRLADVIPPPGADRTPRFAALVSLTRSGDELAARALLQLLLPGLVRLWERCYGPPRPYDPTTAVDLLTTTWMLLVERVATGALRPDSPRGLLLNVGQYTRRARRCAAWMATEVPLIDSDGTPTTSRFPYNRIGHNRPPRPLRARSAEDEALAEPLAATILTDAIDRGALSAIAAEVVWRCAVHHDGVPDAAAACGLAVSTAYGQRDRAHDTLRHMLADAS